MSEVYDSVETRRYVRAPGLLTVVAFRQSSHAAEGWKVNIDPSAM